MKRWGEGGGLGGGITYVAPLLEESEGERERSETSHLPVRWPLKSNQYWSGSHSSFSSHQALGTMLPHKTHPPRESSDS